MALTSAPTTGNGKFVNSVADARALVGKAYIQFKTAPKSRCTCYSTWEEGFQVCPSCEAELALEEDGC